MTEKELQEKQIEKLNHILEMLEVIAGNTAEINMLDSRLSYIEEHTEKTKKELEKLNRKVGN